MTEQNAQLKASPESSDNLSGSYVVYLAGELFNQYDLAANVHLKEAVWRLSSGRFEIDLPQSKELRQLDRDDLAAFIRNADILRMVDADILIARFDGQELDTGAVVEFMLARMLGKPSVILRSDSRHLDSSGLDEPYNLMVKNWPRTIELHVDSFINYVQLIGESRETIQESASGGLLLDAELTAARQGIDSMATRLIEALNSVLELDSPYPANLRESVYQAVRHAPGFNFDQLLTEHHLKGTIQRLKEHETF